MADGDLTLNDNPNVDTGYVESGGKLHQVHLTRQLNGTLELNDDNYNVDTGYVTVNGKKHRVHLVADISSGGGGGGVTSVNGQTGVVVLTGADLTTLVTVSTATLTQELASDTIYDCGELTALTITVPATMDAKYISQVNFTSRTIAFCRQVIKDGLATTKDLINAVMSATTMIDGIQPQAK